MPRPHLSFPLSAFLLLALLLPPVFPTGVFSGESGATSVIREGDILFHTSTSSQSALIRLLTNSPWTHCGIVLRHKGQLQVLEAVQPVKLTPVAVWTARGRVPAEF